MPNTGKENLLVLEECVRPSLETLVRVAVLRDQDSLHIASTGFK